MFKNIPGNKDISVNLDGEFRDTNTLQPIQLQEVMTLPLYGKPVTKPWRWFALAAHFEMELPNGYDDLLKVDFTRLVTTYGGTRCGYRPYFTQPVMFGDLRVVPSYPTIAVSSDGKTVIDWTRDKTLTIATGQYLNVNVYAPETMTASSGRVLHRMVGEAWVDNPRRHKATVINHKDGDKLNPHYTNLEWCTQAENLHHSLVTGLNTQNMRCRVKDFKTGEVSEYESVNAACRALGLNWPINLCGVFNPSPYRLYKDRYEFKAIDDDSPWKSINFGESKKVDFVYMVHHKKTQDVEFFYDTGVLKKHYGLWNTSNFKEAIERFILTYPDLYIFYCRQIDARAIELKHIESDIVYEFESVRAAVRALKISRTGIKHRLNKGMESTPLEGYLVRYKSFAPWPKEYVKVLGEIQKILALYPDGREVVFDSLRNAEDVLKISRFKIKRFCKLNIPHDNIKLSFVK